MASLPNVHELPEIKVYLNIYDINRLNKYLHPMGLGAYHTGVHFYDVEFAFGSHEGAQTGVYEGEPRHSKEGIFRYSIYMGTSKLSMDEVLDAIEDLKIEYAGCTYNIFTKNCNHFSNDLCKRLVGKGIPNYLNRLAFVSACFRCLIPKRFYCDESPKETKSKHRKADSIYLASKRIHDKKRRESKEGTTSNELLSLKQNDHCLESNDV